MKQPRRAHPSAVSMLSLAILAAVVCATCSKDLDDSVLLRQPRPVPARYGEAGLGLDTGLVPTAPLRQFAVAGASLPRSGGAGDLLVGFVAFVTAAAADDGDGLGTPLDRSAPPPADGNGADDVFLAAVVNTERLIDGRPTPAAFVQGIAPIMRDPRCTRCHSFHYPGGWRENGHIGSLPKGSNAQCGECHRPEDILRPGIAPTTVSWFAPDAEQNHVPSQDLRGRTDRELFDLLVAVPDPANHLTGDERILWAVEHGRVPFRGQSVGGRIPIDPQLWRDLARAWDLAGRPFSTTAAVRDVTLVSRRDDDSAAGDGPSHSPSLTFVPNPSYVPTSPGSAPAGFVLVAFASAASDLLTGATANRQHIYRATVEVWLDLDGDVDLRVDAAAMLRVSERSGGGEPDGASAAPAIARDGDRIAFESLATDLVPGFADRNGPSAPDVYVRSVTATTTWLASQSAPSAGGDGAATAPAIDEAGDCVAFTATATDLVPGDTNGRQDVFVALAVASGPVLRRASVQSGGAEARFGDCHKPALWTDAPSGTTWVAFASDKQDLVPGAPGGPAVYLHRLDTAATTRLASLPAATAAPIVAPDGSRIALVSPGDLDPSRRDAAAFDDVFTFDFAAFRQNGGIAFSRHSVAATGADGTAAAAAPVLAGFRNLSGTLQSDLLLGFTTAATNLGRAPGSDLVLQFLADRMTPRTSAEFNAVPRAGTAPLSVSFNDLSSNATSWQWDFGDGQTSTLQHPLHTYAAVGAYDVVLTVTGPGGTVTASKPGYIAVAAAAKPWSQIYAENLMASSCATASCHGVPLMAPFSMTSAAVAYANLVNVESTGACAPTPRVTPNNPAASVLLDRVQPTSTCGPRMGNLGPQAIQDLIDWIQAGAPP